MKSEEQNANTKNHNDKNVKPKNFGGPNWTFMTAIRTKLKSSKYPGTTHEENDFFKPKH